MWQLKTTHSCLAAKYCPILSVTLTQVNVNDYSDWKLAENWSSKTPGLLNLSKCYYNYNINNNKKEHKDVQNFVNNFGIQAVQINVVTIN